MAVKSSVKVSLGIFLIASLLAMTGSCTQNSADPERQRDDSIRRADSIADEIRQANDLTFLANAYADSILATLSSRQKVAMLLMPAAYSKTDDATIRRILEYSDSLEVGGIVLLKGDLQSAALISDTVKRHGIASPFIAVDAENGLKMRFNDAPEFPWSNELGRLSDDQLMYEFGREIARECRIVGIDMVLGPVMDVVPGSGYSGLMRKRSLGSNPGKVADLAIAYSRGLEDGNVISVAKHFPGHGSAGADTHKALGVIRSSREVIDSIDLYPFRRYAQERLSGVMVGHLSVKALDSIRRPAVVSPVVMQDILRKELGFNGLIITDALNMEGASGVRAWQAIAAGADMIIAPSDTKKEINEMLSAINRGDLTIQDIDDRCRRILFFKYLVRINRPGSSGKASLLHSDMQSAATSVNDSIRSNLRHR